MVVEWVVLRGGVNVSLWGLLVTSVVQLCSCEIVFIRWRCQWCIKVKAQVPERTIDIQRTRLMLFSSWIHFELKRLYALLTKSNRVVSM